MTPGKLDLKLYRYAAFSRTLAITVGEPSAPFDLSQYEVRAQIRPAAGSLDILCDLTEGNGRLVVTGNEIRLFIPDTLTRQFDWTAAVWDMHLAIPGDPQQSHRLLEGVVTLADGVTR